MQPIAIEKTWNTKEWQHRPYAFIIGVTTVNAQQGFERLGGHEKVPTLQFRRNLARHLLNTYVPRVTMVNKYKRPKGGIIILVGWSVYQKIPVFREER